MSNYQFKFNKDMCFQCHACEMACKQWRGTKDPIKFRKVIAVEKGSFPDVDVKYISRSCMHCANPKCKDACPVDAITKREDGIVVVDKNVCVGCQACAEACPINIPQFDEYGKMVKCDMCVDVQPQEQRFPCARHCPTKALGVTDGNDFTINI